jgi:hypothetical protein
MSVFSTIAHGGSLSTAGWSRRGATTIGVLALLVSLGVFFVTDSGDEPPVAVNKVTPSLTQDELMRLNTTALDALVPAVVVASQMDVNPFLYWNTTALEALVPATSGAQEVEVNPFLYWNTTALEYPQARYTEPESGPH